MLQQLVAVVHLPTALGCAQPESQGEVPDYGVAMHMQLRSPVLIGQTWLTRRSNMKTLKDMIALHSADCSSSEKLGFQPPNHNSYNLFCNWCSKVLPS
jgi:hypothetical protein